MSDKEVKTAYLDFLGIRVLTPLEEEAASGGFSSVLEMTQHDHDHNTTFNQHGDHDHD
jgi:hypothetical protein